MTRKEEIEKAAEDYYNEVKYLSDLSAFPIAAFKAGAEWADRTMIDNACKAYCDVCLTGGCEKHLEGCIWLNSFKHAMKGE